MENGLYEGTRKYFYKKKVLKVSANFKNDNRDGIWKYDSRNGILRKEIHSLNEEKTEEIKY